jgi:hypothetical protein
VFYCELQQGGWSLKWGRGLGRLGSACLLNVVHVAIDGVTYANIQNASPLLKGMEAPRIVNKPRAIDINSIPFEELDRLPEFIQTKMKSSEEYVGRLQHSANMAGGLRRRHWVRPLVAFQQVPRPQLTNGRNPRW